MNFPVFDLHCDTALRLMGEDMRSPGSLRKNDGHIDLERAAALPGYAQCFACFTAPQIGQSQHISPVQVFERELATIMRETEKNSDLISIAYTADEIEQNLKNHRMSAILTIEGTAGFDYDPALLEDLYQVGFRISSLGWNENNPLTGSNVTGGGLTDRGREYAREAQRLGMLIDVSHISDQGFWDLIEMTEAPIVATHSNSRHVWEHSRNLTDDMFLAICRTGGVAGFNEYADFVGKDPDLDAACEHFLHFLELDPEGRHIALGGDLDGCGVLPQGFDGVQSYPALAQKLLDRGVGENIVHRIFWDNALEVLNNCSM